MWFTVSRTTQKNCDVYKDVDPNLPPCAGAVESHPGFGDNHWIIKIDTIDELMEFIRENGEVVITDDGDTYDDEEIEIYDDDREVWYFADKRR